MSETTRELTWQQRQRSQQARRQLAEALKHPPQVSDVEAAQEAVSRVSTRTVGASVRRAGLTQAAAMTVGATASRLALDAAINPSITRLARGGLASLQVGRLLGLEQSVVRGFAVDVGRFGAFAQVDAVTKVVNNAVGVSAMSKAVQGIGASVLGDFAKGLDVNRFFLPAMPSVQLLAGSVVRPAFEEVHRTLNVWSRTFSFDSFGRSLARIPLVAALRARGAALRGDLAAVREFIVHWLERKPTPPMLEATVDALLEDDWIPYDDDVVTVEVIEHLQRQAGRYTRRHKMIGETQIVGRSVDSLDRLVPVGRSGDRLPLVAVTADPSTVQVDGASPESERRALRALDQFKPDEQQVLLAWEPGMTWQEAADAAGLAPEIAERVRRKRKRVAAEEARRAAALAATQQAAG